LAFVLGRRAGAGRAGLLHWLLGWPGVRGLLVANVLLFVGLCLLLRNPRLAGWLILGPAPLACFAPGPAAVSRAEPAAHRRRHGRADLCQRGGAACGDPGRPWYRTLPGCQRPRGHRARFAEQVRQGRTLQGFVECIEACGELLSEHVPPTHARNELPNRLVILD
jgi:putative membrane protein